MNSLSKISTKKVNQCRRSQSLPVAGHISCATLSQPSATVTDVSACLGVCFGRPEARTHFTLMPLVCLVAALPPLQPDHHYFPYCSICTSVTPPLFYITHKLAAINDIYLSNYSTNPIQINPSKYFHDIPQQTIWLTNNFGAFPWGAFSSRGEFYAFSYRLLSDRLTKQYWKTCSCVAEHMDRRIMQRVILNSVVFVFRIKWL